ncbi:hypothetical protein ASE67_04275 [Sphingomonas sp. Leaf23]|uniref:hypothetical protein n=1 Tax=Sphingomonas sp. Leaf23 TaxID=1735689 RepID=UPI0006FD90C3|nr:hypothetical protein [Sphingomonas sp. Leaf23]KQM86973.1 hypothetical protein ASE67_04275 [Sphingomonas sp. Leaf23]
MADEHKPTKKMAANAEKGLKLREEFDRGGTEVGVKRAKQIVEGGPMSDADVKSMHSYFARHKVDKDTKAHSWGDDNDPSAGYIAWLLWGGDEGRDWAERQHEQLDS